ncbi:MAG: hypothetical protein ACRD8O_13660 [Bryobacteraceae bacterium]
MKTFFLVLTLILFPFVDGAQTRRASLTGHLTDSSGGALAGVTVTSFGNSGRNILDGPGSLAVNLSLLKDTRVSEDLNVQFRVETFNAFNRTNFNLPDLFAGSPAFGRIQSAGSPRHVQIGVKLLW